MLVKSKENDVATTKLKNRSSSITKTYDSQESVIFKDITNNESNSDDDSFEKEIPQVVQAQVFENTEEFTKILKEKGKYFRYARKWDNVNP